MGRRHGAWKLTTAAVAAAEEAARWLRCSVAERIAAVELARRLTAPAAVT